jgi:hypothetical protein
MFKVRIGGRYKTRGYAPVDLFGYVPGQETYTVLSNTDGWCDDLPYVCIGPRGNKVCTVDEQGRVYPPNYRGSGRPFIESPYDLIEEAEGC